MEGSIAMPERPLEMHKIGHAKSVCVVAVVFGCQILPIRWFIVLHNKLDASPNGDDLAEKRRNYFVGECNKIAVSGGCGGWYAEIGRSCSVWAAIVRFLGQRMG